MAVYRLCLRSLCGQIIFPGESLEIKSSACVLRCTFYFNQSYPTCSLTAITINTSTGCRTYSVILIDYGYYKIIPRALVFLIEWSHREFSLLVDLHLEVVFIKVTQRNIYMRLSSNPIHNRKWWKHVARSRMLISSSQFLQFTTPPSQLILVHRY